MYYWPEYYWPIILGKSEVVSREVFVKSDGLRRNNPIEDSRLPTDFGK